jgi:hypothetical protein
MTSARRMLSVALVASTLLLGATHAIAAPLLVGQWIFGKNATAPLADTTGNFGPLTLHGAATISGNELVMSAAGDYAISGNYTGPLITDKTLVAWVSLSNLAPAAGTALTLETNSGNNFDGIVYGENAPGVWNAGSNNFFRTNTSPTGTPESTTNQLVEVAITYKQSGGSELISIYRDGVLYNTPYSSSNLQNYDNLADSAITDVIFGRRHGQAGGQPYLAGSIFEAQIFNGALTLSQINSLQPVPEPNSLVLCGLGSLGLLVMARRRRKA